jgi:hypothetical protein
LRLVRVAKRDPRVIEQCLPDFWQSPDHDDVYQQILDREQDEEWRYALISTSATVGPKKANDYPIKPQAAGSIPQHTWWSASWYLKQLAALLGMSEEAVWPKARNAIRDGLLGARGSCFGLDHQPFQREWIRLRMWDDVNGEAIFLRAEKGNDLIPPQRVPATITNLEFCADNFELLWGGPAPDGPKPSVGDAKRSAQCQSCSAACRDVVTELAEFIFDQHPRDGSRRKTKECLRQAAINSGRLESFTKIEFSKAYRRVYESKKKRPPLTGWPLCEPYRIRLDREKSETQPKSI